MALSAMNSLLCMRCCMREKSLQRAQHRATRRAREPASGLNRRISMLGSKARRSTCASAPDGVEVVQQHAHAHAAPGGVAQALQQRSVLASAWMA
jgi:hypothetical protein